MKKLHTIQSTLKHVKEQKHSAQSTIKLKSQIRASCLDCSLQPPSHKKGPCRILLLWKHAPCILGFSVFLAVDMAYIKSTCTKQLTYRCHVTPGYLKREIVRSSLLHTMRMCMFMFMYILKSCVGCLKPNQLADIHFQSIHMPLENKTCDLYCYSRGFF